MTDTQPSPPRDGTPGKRTWRTWVKWSLRIGLGLIAVVTIAAGIAAGIVWMRLQAVMKPSDFRPEQPLSAFVDEAPPQRASPPPAAPFEWSAIDTPPRTAMPWTRWWWPGGDVEAQELRRELEELRAAGFGGAEVQPFAMNTSGVVKDDTSARERVFSVDTPRYFALLRGMLEDADKLGLQIDLSHYSGWPAGSPVVTPAEGLQTLAWSEHSFSGGRRVDLEIPRPTPGLNTYASAMLGMFLFEGDFADFDAASARLMSVVVARPLGGGHSRFSLSDTLRLDPASVQVVDGQVRDGRLSWDAPEGDWVLVASWLLPTGEQPSLAALNPPGYVLDLLRGDMTLAHYNYAFGARTGLPPYYGKSLRGIFNDSYEYKIDRLGSIDILDEFQRRRGYDLRPYLPAIYVDGADNWPMNEFLPPRAPSFTLSDLDPRVRYDYQLTLSDLVIERFGDPSREWAEARGLLSRQQSYGLDLDILRAQGSNHIPETEQLYAGGTREFFRMASSAALLYGRQLVSSESFVWAGLDYAVDPSMLKAAADQLLVSGVNHIIYHGFPYDWRREEREALFGEAGWNPWSSPSNPFALFSGNYSPRASLWEDIPALNAYIGRAQHLLRQGQPVADVLIYYPFLGYRSLGYGQSEAHLPLIGGTFPLSNPAGFAPDPGPSSETVDERIQWLRRVRPLLDELDRRGLTWSWVNGDALHSRLLPGGQIQGGATYGAIVFPEVEAVAPEDLAAARTLQSGGVPVFILGPPPRRQPGRHQAAEGDARVQSLARDILAGQPALTSPGALADALAARPGPSLRFASASPLWRQGRRLEGGGHIDFLVNPTSEPQSVVLQASEGNTAWWFDAATGGATPVATDSQGGLRLALQPYESRFLIRGIPMPQRLARPEVSAHLGSRILNTWALPQWSLSVGQQSRSSGLIDWRQDEALRHESQAGVYRATFDAPALSEGSRYMLDVGPVPGMAAVRVNGVAVGRVSLPPWRIDITSALRAGSNALEIEYRPSSRNAMIKRAIDGDPRMQHFLERKDGLVPAGLRGPIRIVEM
ncbi:glycosyl hydrolase [Hyalangium gracile]|uniref:glycosyl hydrolase n=1 Tax=Hyalangium gracile TaxID=394092 RepID=UPI001CCDD6D2|nr:glycosyl hydrolase [Hyalangium gracile]